MLFCKYILINQKNRNFIKIILITSKIMNWKSTNVYNGCLNTIKSLCFYRLHNFKWGRKPVICRMAFSWMQRFYFRFPKWVCNKSISEYRLFKSHVYYPLIHCAICSNISNAYECKKKNIQFEHRENHMNEPSLNVKQTTA